MLDDVRHHQLLRENVGYGYDITESQEVIRALTKESFWALGAYPEGNQHLACEAEMVGLGHLCHTDTVDHGHLTVPQVVLRISGHHTLRVRLYVDNNATLASSSALSRRRHHAILLFRARPFILLSS